jgi:hypothetical protein
LLRAGDARPALQTITEAIGKGDQEENAALSEDDVFMLLSVCNHTISLAACTEVGRGGAAHGLAAKLLQDMPDLTDYESTLATAIPVLCESVRLCFKIVKRIGGETGPDSAAAADPQACALANMSLER